MSTFMIPKFMLYAVIFAVTQQIAMEYAGKHLFWSKGEMEVPLEFANSCDQPIF